MSRDKLAGALGGVSRALPSKPLQPMLSGISLEVIEVDGSHVLMLLAGDGENWVRTRIECTASEAGKVVVPGSAFADLVKDLPGDSVTLSSDGDKFSIKLKRGSYALPVFKDSPQFTPSLDGVVGTVTGPALAEAVAQVAVAVAKSESLPVLSGVRMEVADGVLTLAATDRYRLSSSSVPITTAPDSPEFEVVIPVKQLADIAKLLGKSPQVTISSDSGTVAFTTVDTSVHTRVLGGEYPAWRKLLGSSPTRTVQVDAAELAGVIKRSSRINGDVVTLSVEDGCIVVSGSSGDSGSGSEAVDAVIEPAVGDSPVNILFNPGSLLDGLATMSGGTVTLSMIDPVKPILISDGSAHTYLAMPRR